MWATEYDLFIPRWNPSVVAVVVVVVAVGVVVVVVVFVALLVVAEPTIFSCHQ